MDEESVQQRLVPVIEEELVTGTHAVKTGSVRVRKEVERVRKEVEMPALQDVVEVTRVAVNREISAMPQMREEGDTLIIPVVEEEIVVQKRLILKEEIRIVRRQLTSMVTQSINLDREHATVERLDNEGEVVATSKPGAASTPASRFEQHKSLLK